MGRAFGVEWIWDLGQWRSLNLRRPGTSGCFSASKTPIPAFLCPGSTTSFLAHTSGSPLVPLCFSLFASLFPSHCLWGSFCLFFLPLSICSASLSCISISFSLSLSPPSLPFFFLFLFFLPPPHLSLYKIYPYLDVPVALCLWVSPSLCLSLSLSLAFSLFLSL